MSQSGLTDPAREADWDAWYIEHLRIMVSVDGVDTAQRFRTTAPGYSPSLAMYTMRSGDVFQDPYYLSIRGLGEFLPLIDRTHYHRNLFSGLERAPVVADGDVLLVWDAATPCGTLDIPFAWLEAVAIDRSTPYRGIAVVEAGFANSLPKDIGFASYRPATAAFHKPMSPES